MSEFANLKVKEFLQKASSSSPTPGGGTVSAMMGALGASLLRMVAELTVGKKGYEEVWEEMGGRSEELNELMGELSRLMDEDSKAFDAVMEAFSLPKESEEEKAARREAIQRAFKLATEVPLKTAKACLKALEHAPHIAEKGNKNSISDVGVGALACMGGLRGALLNVKINTPSIKDVSFREAAEREAEELMKKGEALYEETMDRVERVLEG